VHVVHPQHPPQGPAIDGIIGLGQVNVCHRQLEYRYQLESISRLTESGSLNSKPTCSSRKDSRLAVCTGLQMSFSKETNQPDLAPARAIQPSPVTMDPGCRRSLHAASPDPGLLVRMALLCWIHKLPMQCSLAAWQRPGFGLTHQARCAVTPRVHYVQDVIACSPADQQMPLRSMHFTARKCSSFCHCSKSLTCPPIQTATFC
jgi:hypothetical protein